MAIKDLIKIKFKKPELSDDDAKKEEKKGILEKSFENAFSRQESIEILNANGKTEDVALLSRLLALDLVNLSLLFFEKSISTLGHDWLQEIKAINQENLTSLYAKYPEVLLLSSDTRLATSELAEEWEAKLSLLIENLDKFFNKIKKSDLRTPLSDQISRWKLQGGILSLSVLVVVGSFTYRRVKYPDLTKTDIQLFFMTKESPHPKEEDSLKTPILIEQKGDWVEYNFDLPKPTDLIEIKIDPVQQSKVRFSFEWLKFFDSKGKLVHTQEFKWGDDMFPKDKLNYAMINDLKTVGSAVPGVTIDMISLGSDPFVLYKLPALKGISKIQFKIRHLEAYKKFK